MKPRTLILAVFGLFLATPTVAQEGAVDLVLRGVTVLDPETGTRTSDQMVLVAGDRVVEVRPDGDGLTGDGARVVDADGLFVIPGLWDLHTHLSMTDPHGPPLMVTQGVTGARDLGGVLDEVEALRTRILDGEVLGPRIVRVGPTLNGAPNGPHHRVIDSPEAARVAVDELQSAGVDLLKTHNATEREPYFALLEHASAAGLDVVGHIPVTVTPMEACEAGQASIDHIVTVFEGTYMSGFEGEMQAFQSMEAWLDTDAPELVECFVREETFFVPTLRTYQYRAHRAALYDDPPEGWEYLSEEGRTDFRTSNVPSDSDRLPIVIRLREQLVEVGQTFTRMLYEAGAPIGTGTDIAGATIPPGFSVHREVELLVEAGLPPHAAIWAAVRGPGDRVTGDPLIGTIAPGSPADLVLLRSDPFEDVGALSDIDAVVLRGRWLDRGALDQTLAQLLEG